MTQPLVAALSASADASFEFGSAEGSFCGVVARLGESRAPDSPANTIPATRLSVQAVVWNEQGSSGEEVPKVPKRRSEMSTHCRGHCHGRYRQHHCHHHHPDQHRHLGYHSLLSISSYMQGPHAISSEEEETRVSVAAQGPATQSHWS